MLGEHLMYWFDLPMLHMFPKAVLESFCLHYWHSWIASTTLDHSALGFLESFHTQMHMYIDEL